jgi:CheY-like chemotaxis protein
MAHIGQKTALGTAAGLRRLFGLEHPQLLWMGPKQCGHSRALDHGHPYDLICLDLNMPVMGGLEALKLIRQEEERRGRTRPPAAKIVIATAAGDHDSISLAFHELCDAYLLKPIDGTELLNLVYCLCPVEKRVQ